MVGSLIKDTLRCAGLLTRLPIADRWFKGFDGRYDLAARAFPLVGAAVGFVGFAALALSMALGLPDAFGAVLAVLAMIVLTGALHDDGLADAADGLAGRSAERRIEIMRDSAVGAYGVLALILSLCARIVLVATLADASAAHAATAMVAAGAVSRSAMVWLWHSTLPASATGAARSAGQPRPEAVGTAIVIALVSTVPALVVIGAAQVLVALLLVAGACGLVRRHAVLRLGGHTGDLLGATSSLAEIAALAGFASLAGLASPY